MLCFGIRWLCWNTPIFLLGTALYGTSFALYVNALSRTRLSLAYPFIGLTYVLVVFLSAIVLNEPVKKKTTVLGALFVFAGVSLIGITGSD
jgi:drug/metabolite transporter (DMT)-like permease